MDEGARAVTLKVETIGTGPSGESRARDETSVTVVSRHDAERPGLGHVEHEPLRPLAAHDLRRSGVAPHRHPHAAPRHG